MNDALPHASHGGRRLGGRSAAKVGLAGGRVAAGGADSTGVAVLCLAASEPRAATRGEVDVVEESGDEKVDEGGEGADDGGEGGAEGGGGPGGSASARAVFVARGAGEAPTGDGRAPRLRARSSSMRSSGGGGGDCCGCGGGGGGSGKGGGGASSGGGGGSCGSGGGCGGGGAAAASCRHKATTLRTRKSRARCVSSACAAARSRERTLRLDGSLVSREPLSTLPLDSAGLGGELRRGIHVTLPSAWVRNE